MKLFEKIQQLVKGTPKIEPEIFLSLILDESYVQAGAWVLDDGKKPRIVASTSERAAGPAWDDRMRMADHAIGKLEEEAGTTKLSKVVFGLGARFLTKDGDIEKSVRSNLKLLTKSLELAPLGFVPLSTSIVHFLRRTEGIPTSVILISVTEKIFDISIYRVGRLAYSVSVNHSESEGEDIENGLKGCTDADVLPSRILLYGADDIRIQETKSQLLRYQWTSKANFLHYPKIEIFPFDRMIDTVVESGASEITQQITEEESAHKPETENRSKEETGEEETTEFEKEVVYDAPLTEEPRPVHKEEKGHTHMVVVQPETLGFHEGGNEREKERNTPAEEVRSERLEPAENPLEFADIQKENLLEKEEELNTKQGVRKSPSSMLPIQTIEATIHVMKKIFRRIPKKLIAIGVVAVAFLFLGYYILTHYVARATVMLSVLPKVINLEDTVVIDPQAVTIDTEKKVIPGKKLEKVVSGEKSVPATGKKKVGDPAKGTVTLFNKTEGTAYTLKKGTLINTGTLQFTIDSDVSIASASMSLSGDQLTFGKTSTAVTAVVVGTEGNIEANKEFSVKEYANSVLVARNEKAFTGGTSKDVTVVSRADYDTLLKVLTSDLIEKAKGELTQSVSGKDRMIEQTIKTAVKEKQYVEEIDQEAKDLHGSLTVSVSAYTYNEDDVQTLLSGFVQKDIPSGYMVNPGKTTVAIGPITVAKDGKMTTKATLTSYALPNIEEVSVKKMIAGKKLREVENELRTITGVASAEFTFQSSWRKDVLPVNPNHISITVSTGE